MMIRDYADIKGRLGEPLWYDDHGVPRYEPFNPRMCGVYDNYVALIEIACQACGERFMVASTVDYTDIIKDVHRTDGKFSPFTLNDDQLPKKDWVGLFGWGDPPPHNTPLGKMCAGSAMMAIEVRILEFWHKPRTTFKWERIPKYEIEFDFELFDDEEEELEEW